MVGNISLLEQYLRLYQNAISQEEDSNELIGDLLSIFRNYSLWEQQLQALADAHMPIQAMIDKMAEIIRNPIYVFDIHGNLLGASFQEKCADIPTFSYASMHRRMPASALTIRYVDRSGAVHTDLSDHPTLTRPENGTERECMAMYLSVDGERVGYCMVVQIHEEELDLDTQFLPFLRSYLLEAEEFTSVTSPARSNRTILSDLLMGKGITEEAAAKFLKDTCLQPPFQLLEIHSNGIVNYTQRSMLIRDLKMMDLSLFVIDHEASVLVLLGEAQTDALLQGITRNVRKPSSRLTVGISMPFGRLDEVPSAHHQCLFTITAAEGRDGVFYCKEFAFPYLLGILEKAEMTRDLLHPAVRILRRYDHENSTDLFRTLDVYLQHGMNQIRTAQELFIHRNTLKYRLGRIRELINVDLDNPEETLYLSLSFRLSAGLDDSFR